MEQRIQRPLDNLEIKAMRYPIGLWIVPRVKSPTHTQGGSVVARRVVIKVL